jgi:hypothetical protein
MPEKPALSLDRYQGPHRGTHNLIELPRHKIQNYKIITESAWPPCCWEPLVVSATLHTSSGPAWDIPSCCNVFPTSPNFCSHEHVTVCCTNPPAGSSLKLRWITLSSNYLPRPWTGSFPFYFAPTFPWLSCDEKLAEPKQAVSCPHISYYVLSSC